ncbi:MAG: response regulator [Acidobacteriota bacterium]
MLVVDDEPEVRHLFSEVLGSAGFDCAEAPNAEQAWRLLEQGLLPAGILLDLRMPGIGGLAFLRQLRADARYAALPVSIVTGESIVDPATRVAVDALDAGFTFKPVEIDDLIALARTMAAQALRGPDGTAGTRKARSHAKRPGVSQKRTGPR